GGRVGTYERAGSGGGEHDAIALGRNACSGGGGASGIERAGTDFWSRGWKRVFRGLHDCGGRRLSTTDGICGVRHCGSVREQCSSGESGSKLCAASDVQCGESGGGDGHVCGACAATPGRSTWRGCVGTSGGRICRSGRWIVL